MIGAYGTWFLVCGNAQCKSVQNDTMECAKTKQILYSFVDLIYVEPKYKLNKDRRDQWEQKICKF